MTLRLLPGYAWPLIADPVGNNARGRPGCKWRPELMGSENSVALAMVGQHVAVRLSLAWVAVAGPVATPVLGEF